MKLIIPLVILFISLLEVTTYRILGLFPEGFKSHNIFFRGLMKGLAKRGHKVDVITYYETPNPPENYTTLINLSELDFPHPAYEFDSNEDIDKVVNYPLHLLAETYGTNLCEFIGHKKIHDFIMNPPKNPAYDLFIVEGWGMSCFCGIGYLWNIPIITVTPSLEAPWINNQIGNPSSAAFYPSLLMTKGKLETFWERLENTVHYHRFIFSYYYLSEKPQTEIMRKYLSPNMPTVREIERSVALSLVNTHHTLQGIRPTTPAFVEVGGLHIENDDSSFSTGLRNWMDESKNGVVYVAIGSLLPLETLSTEKFLAIYSSLSKIAPVRVLLKRRKGRKLPPGLPKNVKTMTWIPQIPVLKHNNTRAFITHCGLHSIQESIYYGVPMIGIPFLYDQDQNADILVNKNVCIRLKPEKITEKSLDEALEAILNDPKYREATRNLSRVFRDRPMTPFNTAAFWIEYIIRNGAKSLRSPAIDLYWWQTELLDVYGFLLLILALSLYIIKFILKTLLKLSFKNEVKSELKRD